MIEVQLRAVEEELARRKRARVPCPCGVKTINGKFPCECGMDCPLKAA